jgi:hypothetical protein
MRKLVQEVAGEGLDALLGENVTLLCANYFYTGKLIGVNETCILLENASVVFDTGSFSDPKWKNVEALGTKNWYVQKSAIESFGVLPKSK